MDCKTARLLLHFTYPRTTELEAGEAAELETHLADCPQCGALAQAERRVDNRIGHSMRAVAVPDGLRTRLLAQLDAEREHWYRRRLTRVAGAVAAAAAVIFHAWLGLSWRNDHPPRIDPDQVANEFLTDMVNPSPATVRDSFESRGFRNITAPSDSDPNEGLNYRLLRYYGSARLQGKSVPMLLFTSGAAQVRVYIVSYHNFDLKDALATAPSLGSGCKVEFWPPPAPADRTNPRFAYVVVYTGDSLQPFRPPSQLRVGPLPAEVP
jgi:hypothetical protein